MYVHNDCHQSPVVNPRLIYMYIHENHHIAMYVLRKRVQVLYFHFAGSLTNSKKTF